MIHDEICTYEVCKLAKEKGFNEYVEAFYAENCDTAHSQGPEKWNEYKDRYAAPTQSLLQRWLREEKGIVIEVVCMPTTRTNSKYEYKRHLFWGSNGRYFESEYGDEIFDTYELALEDALKYALDSLVI